MSEQLLPGSFDVPLSRGASGLRGFLCFKKDGVETLATATYDGRTYYLWLKDTTKNTVDGNESKTLSVPHPDRKHIRAIALDNENFDAWLVPTSEVNDGDWRTWGKFTILDRSTWGKHNFLHWGTWGRYIWWRSSPIVTISSWCAGLFGLFALSLATPLPSCVKAILTALLPTEMKLLSHDNLVNLEALCLSIWTIGIPLYYLIEGYFVIPMNPDCEEAKRYKENREISQRMWLAVGAVLTLLYFGDYYKTLGNSNRDSTVKQLQSSGKVVDLLPGPKGDKGDKGDSVSNDQIIEQLRKDQKLIDRLRGPKGDSMSIDTLIERLRSDPKLRELLRGPKGDKGDPAPPNGSLSGKALPVVPSIPAGPH